jgi:RecG-like helicase
MLLSELVQEGRQVFIVCPMVEEGEGADEDLKSVLQYADTLKRKSFRIKCFPCPR